MRPPPIATATLFARLERTTMVVVAGLTIATGLAWGWPVGGGVLGGGLMTAISYRALKRGVERLGPAPDAEAASGARPRPSPARVALGLVSRYALLLAAAYVIIARLHLHPLGVLVGASAVVIAAMVEAVRAWR